MFKKILAVPVLVFSASAANVSRISNGGFENGTFSSWTALGNVAVTRAHPKQARFTVAGAAWRKMGTP